MKVQIRLLSIVLLAAAFAGCDSDEKNENTNNPGGTTEASCGNVPHGAVQTRRRYEAPQAANPESKCAFEIQTRTCSNGEFTAWSGTYTVTSCFVPSHPSCSLDGSTGSGTGAGAGTGSDENSIPHGGLDYRIRYEVATVAWDAKCKSQTQNRTCTDGVFSAWSGSFTVEKCSITKPLDCLNEKKEKVAHGLTLKRVRFASDWVPFGSKCVSEDQTQTCTNGALSKWTGTLSKEKCHSPQAAGLSIIPTGQYETQFYNFKSRIAVGDDLIFTAESNSGSVKPFRYNLKSNQVVPILNTRDEPNNASPSNYTLFKGEVYFASFDLDGNRSLYKYSKDFKNLYKIYSTTSKDFWAISMVTVANDRLYLRIKTDEKEFPKFYVLNEVSKHVDFVPRWNGPFVSAHGWTGLPLTDNLIALNQKLYYLGLKTLDGTDPSYRLVTLDGKEIPETPAIFEFNPASNEVRELELKGLPPYKLLDITSLAAVGTKLAVWVLGYGTYLLDPVNEAINQVKDPAYWGGTGEVIGFEGAAYYTSGNKDHTSIIKLTPAGRVSVVVPDAGLPVCTSGQGCFSASSQTFLFENRIYSSRQVDVDINGFGYQVAPGAHVLQSYDLKSGTSTDILSSDFKFRYFVDFFTLGKYFVFSAADQDLRYHLYLYNPSAAASPSPSPSSKAGAKPVDH